MVNDINKADINKTDVDRSRSAEDEAEEVELLKDIQSERRLKGQGSDRMSVRLKVHGVNVAVGVLIKAG